MIKFKYFNSKLHIIKTRTRFKIKINFRLNYLIKQGLAKDQAEV
jgi:hypothetical protein